MGKYIQIKGKIEHATKLINEALILSDSLKNEVDGPWDEMEQFKKNLKNIMSSLSVSLTPIQRCIDVEEKYLGCFCNTQKGINTR